MAVLPQAIGQRECSVPRGVPDVRFVVLTACTVAIAVGAMAFGRSTSTVAALSALPAGSPVAACASAGCHGGGEVGRPGSEQSTWAAADPHAKAYSVLFNDLSARMMHNLGRSHAAHRDSACLACHASHDQAQVDGNLVASAADGVGCDSCHGNSSLWIARHYETGWPLLAPEQKLALGFNPTKDLVARISACASCHVGDARRIVDHDLIAAGHPRLAFEYTRFHFQPQWKHHWTESLPRRDFEVRSWLIGQVASLRACLQKIQGYTHGGLLDFSDQSCFACHQRLDGGTRRTPGLTPVWQPWYTAMLEVLAAATPQVFPGASVPNLASLHQLEAALKAATAPANITRLNAEAEQAVALWLSELQRVERTQPDRRLNAKDVRALARAVARSATLAEDWDVLAPHFLALAAFHHADPQALADCANEIHNLQKILGYPDGYNSPAGFDLSACKTAFQVIVANLERQARP